MSLIFNRVCQKAEEIRKAIIRSKLFPPDLCGACGLASLELFEYGRRNRIPILFAYKPDYHCFNVLEESVIDITAAQFLPKYMGMTAVLPITEARRHSWWKNTLQARDRREFAVLNRDNIEFESCWRKQNPYNYSWVMENRKLITVEKISSAVGS